MKKKITKALSLLITLSMVLSLIPAPVFTAQASDATYSPAPGPIEINFGSAELDGNKPGSSAVSPSFEVNGYEFVSTTMMNSEYEANGIWMRGDVGANVNMRIKVPAGKYRVYFTAYSKDSTGGRMSVSVDGQTAGTYDFAATNANTLTQLENTVTVRGKDTYDLVLTSVGSERANFFPGGVVLVPTNELDVVFGSAELSGKDPRSSDVMPSHEVNGYVFKDTTITTAKWINWTSTGINSRAYLNQTITMGIKVPAGKYRVLFHSYNQDPSGGALSISIDGQEAGTFSCADNAPNVPVELENIVTLSGKEEYDLVLKSVSSAASNFYIGGISLVPVAAVRMQFFNKAWANLSPIVEGSMLNLKDYNCEIDTTKTTMSQMNATNWLAHNSIGCLSVRPKVNEKLVLRTFVPDAGAYSVEMTAGYRYSGGGILNVSVGGKDAGNFDFASGTTYPYTETLPNIVQLNAGYNEIVFTGVGEGTGYLNTYPAAMALVPLTTENIKVSAKVNGILKYVGDYADIDIKATSNDVALTGGKVEYTYAWDNNDVVTTPDNITFTAAKAGTAKLTITAKNTATGNTGETVLEFNIAERPTSPENVTVQMYEPSFYVWKDEKSPFMDGYNLNLEDYNCEYLINETTMSQKMSPSYLAHGSNRLNARAKVGEKLAFRIYVPVAGEYAVNMFSGQRYPSAGVVSVTIDGKLAGNFSFLSESTSDTAGHEAKLENVIALEAGYKTVILECIEAVGSTYANLYPAKMELIPVIDEPWTITPAINGIIKYVGDTAVLATSAKTESGVVVDLNKANISYTIAPEGIVSIDEDGNLTALSAGTATITMDATHGDYTEGTQATLKVTVAERPTVAEEVDIQLYEPSWYVWKEEKSPFVEGYNLNIAEYNCEYLINETTMSQKMVGSYLSHGSKNLSMRAKVGEKLAFRTYVPVAGQYAVVMVSGARHSTGGAISVSVAGQEAGIFNFQSDDTTGHSSELKEVVNLDAGYQTIIFTCTESNSGTYANLYPATVKLVPYVEKDWTPYVQLTPSIKYKGDTVDLTVGAKWSDDSEVNQALLEVNYEVIPSDIITIEDGKLTANKAGDVTIKVTAKNLRNGDTKILDYEITVAERPSEQPTISIDFNKAEYGFKYDSSPLKGDAVPNIDDHGYEVDLKNTTCTRYTYNSPSYGFTARPWEGQIMAFRIYVPVRGLYRFDFTSGYKHNSGADIDIYLDDQFVGDYSFNPAPKKEDKGETVHMNTVMLEAGFHSVKFHCTYYNTGGNCYLKGISLVPQTELPELDRVECDVEKEKLFAGEKTKFTAKAILNTDDKFFFYDGAEDNMVITVDGEDVIALSESGEITAIKTGTATITATATVRGVEKSSSVTVQVTDVVLESVTASLSQTWLFPDDTAQITLSATMSDGQKLDMNYPTITLTPINNKISIDENYLLTALEDGESGFTIVAEFAGVSVEVFVPVDVQKRVLELHHVDLSIDNSTIKMGETAQVTAKGIQFNGEPSVDNELEIFYDSQDAKIATVDENGVVTGMGIGTTDIVVHIKKATFVRSARISVTISDSVAPESAAVALSGKLYVGMGVNAYAIATLPGGIKVNVPAESVEFSLVSCDPADAVTVSPAGLVSATAVATAVIGATVTLGGESIEAAPITVTVGEKDVAHTTIIDMGSLQLFDVTDPRNVKIETSGWEVNPNKTSSVIMSHPENKFSFNKTGINTYSTTVDQPLNSDLTFDVMIPESGTYSMQITGTHANGGCLAAVYVDGEYVGKHDFTAFNKGTTPFNCVYMEAGVRSVTLRAISGGSSSEGWNYFFPSGFVFRRITTDHSFAELSASVSKAMLSVGETAQINVSAKMADGKDFVFDPSTLWESKSTLSVDCKNDDVISISDSGEITALAAGSAIIYVTALVHGQEKTTEFPITVDDGVLSGVEAVLDRNLEAGATASLVITAKTDGDRVLSNGDITFTVTPASDGIVSANGTVLTGLRSGNSSVTLTAELNGHSASCVVPVTVGVSELGKLELNVPTKLMKPDSDGIQITAVGYNSAGLSMILDGADVTYTSMNPEVLAVSASGLVTPVSTGVGTITATAVLDGMQASAEITISVRSGKVASTVYTAEKVANARENIELYTWARAERDAAVKTADLYLDKVDLLWESVTTQELPRSTTIGYRTDPNRFNCRYCGAYPLDASDYYSGWIVNPLNNPWKVQCATCRRRFPSNDFEGFYKLGIDEYGKWRYEKALAENKKIVKDGGEGYLVNRLYPEMGEGWGVDDGYGYRTGKILSDGEEEVHTYIAYYNNLGILGTSGIINTAITSMRNAYMYTGDVKYGRVAAIVLDRMADVYPDMDWTPYYPQFTAADSSRPEGRILGKISEPTLMRKYIEAYDALFDMYDDPYVIDYLSKRAAQYNMPNDKSSAEAIRQNIEDGILREVQIGVLDGRIEGNFGLSHAALSLAAIVLDNEPETGEWIEWLFKPGVIYSETLRGGNIYPQLVDSVDRDGVGDEGALSYCIGWASALMPTAEYLELYPNKEYSLFNNVKFRQLIYGTYPMTLARTHTPQIGDGGRTASAWNNLSSDVVIPLFRYTGDPMAAQVIYGLTGGKFDNLRYDIFTKDPESLGRDVRNVIETYGELDMDQSRSFNGFGLSILRDGNYSKSVSNAELANTQRDFWISWNHGYAHRHPDKLNLGIEAFGLNVAPELGYTKLSYGDEYSYWGHSAISHNTVVVNEQNQTMDTLAGVLHHFDDGGDVQVMDVSDPTSYAAADIYRRSLVMVKIDDATSYGVDFFRVKGGYDHLYSFHSLSKDVELTGATLVAQPFGSYAGPDVAWATPKSASGFAWFDNVRRAKNPQTGTFTADFKVTDFRNTLGGGKETDIHLRMTMLNDFDLDEISVVTGYPSQYAGNPESLEYVFARRQGDNLDTLFTTVFEPYKGESNIVAMTQVDVVRIGGADESSDDVVKAIKVDLGDRVDYVVYATNKEVLYRVDDTFDFQGFTGVYTMVGTTVTRVYAHDATVIGDINGTDVSTGTVKDFTRELELENYITITPDSAVNTQDMVGKYIFIENDGWNNAVYEILGATKSGQDVVLDIGKVTTIRKYKDSNDIYAGYVYDFEAGSKYEIKERIAYDSTPQVTAVPNASAVIGRKFTQTVHATSPVGKEITYYSNVLPRGAVVDPITGTLTWTPDSYQAGVHHIAIIATDGAMESAIHFDIDVYKSSTGSGSLSGGSTTPSTPSTPSTGDGGSTGGSAGGGSTAPSTPSAPSGGGAGGGGSTTPSTPTTPDAPATGEGEGAGDAPETPAEKFVDLGNHTWAEDAIYTLVDKGVVNGTSANTYAPANNIKRADFAIMLVRAFGITEGEGENFADVDANKYYAEELRLAKAAGIVNGVGNDKFNPEGEITRQDMMLMLSRALDAMEVELSDADLSALADFADAAQISDYAADAVSRMIKDGIIAGSNGKINPLAKATRAEIAVMLDRVLAK